MRVEEEPNKGSWYHGSYETSLLIKEKGVDTNWAREKSRTSWVRREAAGKNYARITQPPPFVAKKKVRHDPGPSAILFFNPLWVNIVSSLEPISSMPIKPKKNGEKHENRLYDACVMIHKYLATFLFFICFFYALEHSQSSRSMNPMVVSLLHVSNT